MKKLLTPLLGAAVLLSVQAFNDHAVAAQNDGVERYTLNRIAAIVNSNVITVSELDTSMKQVVAQLEGSGTPLPEKNALVKQVLERLVVDELQLQIAERNGLTIDDGRLNEELTKLAGESRVSLSEFQNILEKEGYSYAEFRGNIREKMLLQEVRRQMVANTITVNEQEIDNLLANMESSGLSDVKYHFAHIMVTIPEAAGPREISAAKARAKNILARLRSGSDFTQTAITESEGQNALEGGDLGWRSIGQIPSLFTDTAKKIQPGEVSDLIQSAGGFHIIKLLEKSGDKRKLVNQSQVRHILVKTDLLNTDEDIKLRLEQLESRIRSGEDFTTLARSNSQDIISAAKGGNLGWVSQGETVPRFEAAMNDLDVGELSKPVKTKYGWHLIQVMQRRQHDSTDAFERSQVRRVIQSRKFEEEMFLWLRRLRDESYVEYRLSES